MKKSFMKRLKKTLGLVCLSAVLCAGCGQKTDAVVESTSAQATNQNRILVVSFGTSYNDSRDVTIGAIEETIANNFTDYDVRRAFTSQIVIDVIKDRDKIEIDNVTQALDRAVSDGVKNLIVQPTHLMNGYEYTDLIEELLTYSHKFETIKVGEPLLTSDKDFEMVIEAITQQTAQYVSNDTAICFMGHGTKAASNAVYGKLQEKLIEEGFKDYYVGTVEATPSLDDVIALLEEKDYKTVVLEPLMVVAGDHANNDMAGDEDDSWKTILTAKGYEVECVIKGLGEIPEICNIYVEHIKAAVDLLTITVPDNKTATETTDEITDGSYSIDVTSSSSMFNIVDAKLTVSKDKMSAVITLSGTGYSKLYMGTGEEALKAEESDYINFVEDESGSYTFEIPVEALDTEINCAAWSTKKEEWYDRTLIFESSTVKETENKVADNQDEVKTAAVILSGGSGKTTVESPAQISVVDGVTMATIVWSSANYDYMLVDGEKYLPVNTSGNSTFTIPVAAFDTEINVIADTVAMGTPHEIEYTLVFTVE